MPQHFCGQCPFIANSAAELKRHGRVHSEDKPYICKTCGYCSKWKCDLKKHLRTYDHQSAVPLTYGGHGRKPSDWDKEDKEQSEEENDIFQGKQCHFTADNQHHLDTHMSVHKSGGKLKCKQCEFSVDDLPSFLQHKISHSTNMAAKRESEAHEDAVVPQMKHRRKPLKQNITKTVHEEQEGVKYACEWCAFVADKSQELYQHVRSEHPDDMDADNETEVDLEEKENDMKSAVYACEWCTWSTENSAEMYAHVQSEHQQDINGDVADTTEIKIYRGESRKVAKRRLKQCDKCAYVTDNVSTLQRHMSKHGKKGKYLCHYCDYSVEREHIVEYHMSLVHKDEHSMSHNADVMRKMEEEDDEEGYLGQEENSMDGDQMNGDIEDDDKKRGYTVLQIHHGKRTKYACQKCPYKTENLTNMSNHARQHGAKKKFTCEFCDYSLDQLRHIIKHMKTLHGHDAVTEDRECQEENDAVNGLDDEVEEEEMDGELSDVSENEWEIVEVDSSILEDDSPTKRRRLSRISTSSMPSSIRKYTCKTCGFNTVNKALVAKHNHKEGSEAHDDKYNAKEPNVDINRNTTNSDVLMQ